VGKCGNVALKGEEIHIQDSGGKTFRKNNIYNIQA